MSLLHLNKTERKLSLKNPANPELFRRIYPYTNISRISFDDRFIMPRPADPMFITDTTFRDGQQARPPYSVEQISHIFDLLHKLGGKSGLIRASEFFLYSDKDRRAVEACLSKGYKYPRVTGWIRANAKDLKLVKDMGLTETGMLTSVSDYHIYLKLQKNRKQAMDDYLEVVSKALDWGITPRCHFEDITRADIYGFCIPFAQKLMQLSKEYHLPVKIRLCDTMGYGVPYPGSDLPRSVARIVRAFTDEAEVPGEWLEWHGHNDFHKVLVNGVVAWLYGCGGINGTLLGFGERTGNSPIEALVIEYIQLTGDDDAAETPVISEIAEYFERELGYRVPDNYPFVGKDFNATSAGIHVDGLLKNEEIYNIFDTTKLLNRKVPIIITDKSGRAGVAYWINHQLGLSKDAQIDKRHPAVGKIYESIEKAYQAGRTTSFSNQEMKSLVKRYLPELFASEFDHLKQLAHNLSARLVVRLSESPEVRSMNPDAAGKVIGDFLAKYPVIQFVNLVDTEGKVVERVVANEEDKPKYAPLTRGTDLSSREWFITPMQTGKLHITNFYQSQYTGKLLLTVAVPVVDEHDNPRGVLGADIRFEELLKRHAELDPQDPTEMV
ncbi:isopropylmalate/homocitrate/citramalate synthase [Desulfocurvibacter africanus PCS]|uniref:Isopropylmalate/homocitrate/citramalate synthase n=1 Tax=Desulfocurvibacter africanus PCS TaxID=1262666 RepID=M5Q1C1_DESAF|nr:cache domain-containing protein [Desulfocurvibacter africanus]EMG37441.1 isopropylmalate/homocitrate/citramalate synthase [Desulfocurvibacter africanus PCS]